MTEPGDPQAIDDEREEVTAGQRGEDPDPETDPEPDDGTGHLDDIEDGAGCTEIWERLSERRDD